MVLIIKREKKLFSSKKQNHLPITKNVFIKIIKNKFMTINDLNIDTTFKIIQADFIKLEKITYIIIKAKKISFKDMKVTKSDILFAKRD